MNFDLFDSPELLDIQRQGFYNFLNQGIPQLLAKQFPITIKSGNYSIELWLNEQNVKLIAPDSSPRDCILKMKTYSSKLYAQVKIVCKKQTFRMHQGCKGSGLIHETLSLQSKPHRTRRSFAKALSLLTSTNLGLYSKSFERTYGAKPLVRSWSSKRTSTNLLTNRRFVLVRSFVSTKCLLCFSKVHLPQTKRSFIGATINKRFANNVGTSTNPGEQSFANKYKSPICKKICTWLNAPKVLHLRCIQKRSCKASKTCPNPLKGVRQNFAKRLSYTFFAKRRDRFYKQNQKCTCKSSYKSEICTCTCKEISTSTCTYKGANYKQSPRSAQLRANETIVYQSLPEWVLLGQLPMMTKRGHFIINGSPRVVVHQVVRSPGIYFQKLIKKDEQNIARFYGDIIPLKGVWVRLQMTKKGRIEAKFKKGKKVQVEFLQKCLQVIEDQASLSENYLDTNQRALLFQSLQIENLYGADLACKRRFLKQSEPQLKKAKLSFYTKPQNKQGFIPDLSAMQKMNGLLPNNNLLYEDYSTLLEKRKNRASSKAEHDAFIYTYDKLYRTTQDKELEEWQKKKSNLSFFKGLSPENAFKRKKCSENLFACFKMPSRYDLGSLGREKINDKFGFISGSLLFNGLQTENLMPLLLPRPQNRETNLQLNTSTFSTPKVVRYKYSTQNKKQSFFPPEACLAGKIKNARALKAHSLKSSICKQAYSKGEQTIYKGQQLTAMDLCSATVWLYKLRKGEKCTDDIDHSQNRRVRTSGELIQTQFENGVERLKNLLSTKLQEWRASFPRSTFSSIFTTGYKTRYTDKFLFKSSRQYSFAYSRIKKLTNLRFNASTLHLQTGTNRKFVKQSKVLTSTNLGFASVPTSTSTNQRLVRRSVIENRQPATAKYKYKPSYKSLNAPSYKYKSSYKSLPYPLKGVRQRFVRRFVRKINAPTYKSNICIGNLPKVPKVLNKNPRKDNSYKISVKELFSTKPITGALREFFGSNPLSQYMDQTNPLAEITHKRRMSSLGLGGVSRESAGMAIRGIHPTHYGRICPIETPEGKNAGLVNSLAFYTKIDINGFLKTPYYRVVKGQIQHSLGFSFNSARDESLTGLYIAPSDLQKSSNNILRTKDTLLEAVPVRVTDNQLDVFKKENPYKVQLIGISPIQMISVATSLIPFLEHNDANRALMGSNMQRQAVPLMISERPIVGTGLESIVIVESGHIIESQVSGFAGQVTANKIIIDRLCSIEKKAISPSYLADRQKSYVSPYCLPTSLQQKETIKNILLEQKLKVKGLKRNNIYLSPLLLNAPLQIFDLYKGQKLCYNYKSKTSYKYKPLVKQVKNFCKEKNNTRLYKTNSFLMSSVNLLTTFSRSNQNTCITEKPLIQQFDWVQKGDALSDCSASNNGELAVGKNVLVAYIPWEGYNFEDAIVISERLVREHVYTSLHIERYTFQAQDLKEGNEWFTKHLPGVEDRFVEHLEESGLPKIGSFVKEGDIIVGKIRYLNKKPSSPYERLLCDILGEKNFAARNKSLYVPKGVEARIIYHRVINQFENEPENTIRPAKAARTVNVFLGEKRVIQVGDKISGRHGNKGVISTILPRQDMPYLPDGTPIDLILNPLGVPSRMNVGQVLECLLGLAADYLNQHFKITAFDERYGVEASKSIVFLKLYQARLQSGQNWLFQVNFPGKTRLVDGRSGLCFDQWITVGKAYILKLIHMVSEKIHARSTGPYALITQQPLRGRSNKGGQRLGEMEVWALEGFGAAYTLQELLTKKSDDFFGRKQIVDSILPNPSSIVDTLKPNYRIHQSRPVLGHPEIFKVLLCELQALCLDLGVYVVTPESFQRSFLGIVH